MPSKRMNRNFTYSPELKLQAVKLYLEGHSCQSKRFLKEIYSSFARAWVT